MEKRPGRPTEQILWIPLKLPLIKQILTEIKGPLFLAELALIFLQATEPHFHLPELKYTVNLSQPKYRILPPIVYIIPEQHQVLVNDYQIRIESLMPMVCNSDSSIFSRQKEKP